MQEKIVTSPYVYVVDDDRDVRRSLSFMLGASDIRSYPFGSGIDFLESLPDLEPGCVLLDLRMPDMDGFDVMTALRRRALPAQILLAVYAVVHVCAFFASGLLVLRYGSSLLAVLLNGGLWTWLATRRALGGSLVGSLRAL